MKKTMHKTMSDVAARVVRWAILVTHPHDWETTMRNGRGVAVERKCRVCGKCEHLQRVLGPDWTGIDEWMNGPHPTTQP